MQATLGTATGTLQAGQQPERTGRKNGHLTRIEPEIQDREPQDARSSQDSPGLLNKTNW
ncbi:hypothetical protein ACO2Q8_20525 [Larkinella sp. VNQ87]